MEFINILAIAVALAMDAFAVAIATGVALKTVSPRQAFRLSWHFGLFQAIMPIIGWFGGETVYAFIQHYDHWVAFGLLAFVGGHMIREAFEPEHHREERKDPTKGMRLVMLSVATSIDALAIGFSMSMIGMRVFFPALIIGIVALLFTLVGLYVGARVGSGTRVAHYAEIAGGVVLILIGLNLLYKHGVFAFLPLLFSSCNSSINLHDFS